MSFPWTLIASTLVGIWLMYSPTVFGIDIRTTAADIAHFGGALVVTISVVAMAEVVRAARYLNVLLGLGLAPSHEHVHRKTMW